MNTISITKADTNETVTYTEAEVLRFIQNSNDSSEQVQKYIMKSNQIREQVYEFFNSQYEPSMNEITTSVEEINEMLESIGADTLTRTWSASIRIHVNLSGIVGTDSDDVRNQIQDDVNVELQSIDGDLWVDDIEVFDIRAE